MSNAPNEIIIEVPVGSVLGRNGRGKVQFQAVKYRRADLPPTPAEAMRCQEVMALVEAMRPFAEAAMHLHPATPNDATTLDGIDAGQWRAAYASLSDLEQAVRHE